MNLLPCLKGVAGAYFLLLSTPDSERLSSVDFLVAIPGHVQMIVFPNRFLLDPVNHDILVALSAVHASDEELHIIADLLNVVMAHLDMLVVVDHLELVSCLGPIFFLT